MSSQHSQQLTASVGAGVQHDLVIDTERANNGVSASRAQAQIKEERAKLSSAPVTPSSSLDAQLFAEYEAYVKRFYARLEVDQLNGSSSSGSGPWSTIHDTKYNFDLDIPIGGVSDYDLFIAEARAELERDSSNNTSPFTTRSSSLDTFEITNVDHDYYSRVSLNRSIFYIIDEYELVEPGSAYYTCTPSMSRGQILPMPENGPIEFPPAISRQGSARDIPSAVYPEAQPPAFGQISNSTKENRHKAVKVEDGDVTPKATPRELKPKATDTNKGGSGLKRCKAFVDLPSLANISVAV